MWDSLSAVFNWQWIAQSLVWAIVGSVAMRAWVWWRSGKGAKLSRKREVTFWILAPLTVLILLALITSVSITSQRPHFVGEVAAVNYGMLGPPENRAFVLVAAKIENTGAPSIAKGFKATIQLSSGSEKEGELYTIPEQFTLAYANGTTETVNYADQLFARTVQPIPTGGEAVGRLMYLLRDVSEDVLKSQLTGVKLSFQDVHGTTYMTTSKLDVAVGEARAIIGLAPSLGKASPTPTPTPTRKR
jgi:hypothetical protein